MSAFTISRAERSNKVAINLIHAFNEQHELLIGKDDGLFNGSKQLVFLSEYEGNTNLTICFVHELIVLKRSNSGSIGLCTHIAFLVERINLGSQFIVANRLCNVATVVDPTNQVNRLHISFCNGLVKMLGIANYFLSIEIAINLIALVKILETAISTQCITCMREAGY